MTGCTGDRRNNETNKGCEDHQRHDARLEQGEVVAKLGVAGPVVGGERRICHACTGPKGRYSAAATRV